MPSHSTSTSLTLQIQHYLEIARRKVTAFEAGKLSDKKQYEEAQWTIKHLSAAQERALL